MTDLPSLAAAIDRANELLFVTTPAGELRRYNDRLSAVTGIADADLDGRRVETLAVDADRDRFADAIERVGSTGESVSLGVDLAVADGEPRSYVITGTPLVGSAGAVLGVVGVGIRREAATPGDHESQFFTQVVDRVGVGVATYADDGRFTYVNERFATLLDTTREALIGSALWEVNPTFDADGFDSYWESFDPGETRHAETVHERADGTTVPVETVTTRMTFAGESYNVGTIKDVSARKEWERELKDERDRFTALFEAVPEPVAHIKLESGTSTVQNVNTTFETTFGFEAADVVGESLDEYIVPSHLRDEASEIDDLVAAGRTIEREVKRLTPDGVADFLLRVNPFQTNGSTDEFVAIYSDIGEQKDRERDLERQREQAELLNQIVRHDIRNDMQLITAAIPLLRDAVDDDAVKHVDQIEDRSEHIVELTEIVGDLMTILIEGHDSLEVISLTCALDRQIEKVRDEYDEADLRVDGTIPAVDVLADEMLESVFHNLLTNAIRHNDAETPEVVVSVTERDDRVRVAVADNGPGVPDDRKDEIFGKGERGLQSEGTGIGLYLVSTLVDQYGGEVSVDDSESNGAVFTVELERAE